MRLSSVLLPHPEWPIRQMNSFLSTSIVIESSARKRPFPLIGKAIETLVTLRKAIDYSRKLSFRAAHASAESRPRPIKPINTIATIMLAI